MKNPKVSIIIPAYNISKYIKRCVESAAAQTYQNLEIIIINDGSTDDTPRICQELTKKYPLVQLVSQKNGGLSSARNTGIKKATGEYIAFIDGDDSLEPDFVSCLMDAIQRTKADIAACGYKTIWSNGRTETDIPPAQTLTGQEATIRLLTTQKNYDVIACNKLYRRTLFTKHKITYPVGMPHEDNLTTYKIYSHAKAVTWVPQTLYLYYKRVGSISTSAGDQQRLDIKHQAALEAVQYFKNSPKLHAVAQIAVLLSNFASLDHIITGRINGNFTKVVAQIEAQKSNYLANPYLTKKLRLYLFLLNTPSSIGYRLFRQLKH